MAEAALANWGSLYSSILLTLAEPSWLIQKAERASDILLTDKVPMPNTKLGTQCVLNMLLLNDSVIAGWKVGGKVPGGRLLSHSFSSLAGGSMST